MKELIGTSLLSTYAELLNIPQGDNNLVELEKFNKNNLYSRLIEKIFKMKRIFIMLIVAMFSFSVEAQDLNPKDVLDSINEKVLDSCNEIMKADVTTFLGIPVDGTVSNMKQKLIAKGFKQDSNLLSGQFNGQDVYLSIVANKGKVWRVAVINKTPYSEAQIRLQFNNLVRQFKNSTKYDNVKEYDPTIDESEDIRYEMSAHNKEYSASFLQKSNVEGEIKEKMEQLKFPYLKEISFEDRKKINEAVDKLCNNMILVSRYSKSVCFNIIRNYGDYSILICYNNEYNAPNGEDL